MCGQVLSELLLTLSAHAREGYSSHFVSLLLCQSVCMSLFHSGEGAVSWLKLTSVYILGDDLSPLNVALFENRSYFGEKASGTSAVTAVMYAGTAHSLNGLARDLLARGTLYQSCRLHCSCIGFFTSHSCRLADCFFLSSK